MQEKLNDLKHEQFPAKHKDFYSALAMWRVKLEEDEKELYASCVYILRTDKPVHRVLKTDNRGILYIGKGDLNKNHERIGMLINSLSGTANQHDAGWFYHKSEVFSSEYPLEDLRIDVYFTDHSRDIEAELLRSYRDEFGEFPPLNRVG